MPNPIDALRYGMLGVPAAATIQSAVTACGSCGAGGAPVSLPAVLALLAGAALFAATGSKTGGKK